MRKLLAVIILICGSASGQTFISPSGAARRFVRVNGVPASCTAGDVLVDVSVSPAIYYNCPVATPAVFGGSSGLATDGSTIGATSVIQPFTNGIKTTAATGLVGVGMAPVTMLDVTAPSTLDALQVTGTQPAAVAAGNGTTPKAVLILNPAKGGNTSHTQANRIGGSSPNFSLVTGDGGDQTGASSGSARGGSSGAWNGGSGTGGAATSAAGTVNGGPSGPTTLQSGAGGSSASQNGGASGATVVGSGPGGASSAAGGVSGASGAVTIDSGPAGNASGGATTGSTGSISIAPTNSRLIVIGNSASTTTIAGQLATSGTTPAVSNTTANSCGTTAAAIAGNDATGVITVGATAGTNCTITFVKAAPTRRQCTVTNETTANLSRSTYLTTTTSTVEGTFVAGDLISYVCAVY